MNHEQSIKSQAVEKYLLGELPAAQREAFEWHFFECEVCAAEVRLGFEFKEVAKTIFQEEPRPAVRRAHPAEPKSWFAWIRPQAMVPAAACLAMAIVVGYQGLVEIPSLRARFQELNQPQAFQSTFVLPPSSRAPAPAVSLSAGPFFPLTLSVGAVRPAERYACELRSDSGMVLFRIPVSRLESETNLTLMIPAAGTAAGNYDAVLLAVTGTVSAEIDHYRFVVRHQ